MSEENLFQWLDEVVASGRNIFESGSEEKRKVEEASLPPLKKLRKESDTLLELAFFNNGYGYNNDALPPAITREFGDIFDSFPETDEESNLLSESSNGNVDWNVESTALETSVSTTGNITFPNLISQVESSDEDESTQSPTERRSESTLESSPLSDEGSFQSESIGDSAELGMVCTSAEPEESTADNFDFQKVLCLARLKLRENEEPYTRRCVLKSLLLRNLIKVLISEINALT